MKKRLSALALLAFCAGLWFTPSPASAVPKMDVKVAVGIGSTTLVPRVPQVSIPNSQPPPDFVMVGGQQSARSLRHLAELFRLADRAGLLRDPDLAAARMRQTLQLHGLDG